MRVLFVTNNSHLRSTSTIVNVMLRHLVPKGLTPILVFRESGPWQAELARQGIPFYFHSLTSPDKKRPLRSLLSIWQLVRIIHRERVDLIHCNELEHFPLLRYAARWTRRPLVAVVHWNIEDGYGHWMFRPPFIPSALEFVSQAVLEVSRPGLTTVSEDKLRILMNGLDMDEYLAKGQETDLRTAWGVGPETVILGTASAIRPRKTLEDFIHLVRRLRDSGQNVLGVIAGGGRFADPDYYAKLQLLIQELHLGTECRMIGNLDPITPFMKAIDIFVSTSKWETFGMSVCEAMVCGKPAVAYDAGSLVEVIPDSWCVVPYGDLDGMTERTTKLVSDPAFRTELGNRAERFVREHFDAPVLAARQQAIYEEILNRPLKPTANAGLPPV